MSISLSAQKGHQSVSTATSHTSDQVSDRCVAGLFKYSTLPRSFLVASRSNKSRRPQANVILSPSRHSIQVRHVSSSRIALAAFPSLLGKITGRSTEKAPTNDEDEDIPAAFQRALETHDTAKLKALWVKIIYQHRKGLFAISDDLNQHQLEQALWIMSFSRKPANVKDMIRLVSRRDGPLTLNNLESLGKEAVARALLELGLPKRTETIFDLTPNAVSKLTKDDVTWLTLALQCLIRWTNADDLDGHRALALRALGSQGTIGSSSDIYRGVVCELAEKGFLEDVVMVSDLAQQRGLHIYDTPTTIKVLRASDRYPESPEGFESLRSQLLDKLALKTDSATWGIDLWNWKLEKATQRDGPEAVASMVEKMKSSPVQPNEETISVLLNARLHSIAQSLTDNAISSLPQRLVDEFWDTEKQLEMEIEGPMVMERAFLRVANTIKSNPTIDAHEKDGLIYAAFERVTAMGAQLTVPMAAAVIANLSNHPNNYERINNVRTELLASIDENYGFAHDTREVSVRTIEDQLRLIYERSIDSLLQQNLSDPVPLALLLVDDMRKRSVSFTKPTALRLTSDLMKRALNHHDAFRAYSYIKALDPYTLNEQDYTNIIRQFIRISVPDAPYPDPKLTFEFLRDMRDGRVPVTAQIYTIMIAEYTWHLRSSLRNMRADFFNNGGLAAATPDSHARSAERKEAIRSQTMSTITRIHSIIKLDSFVDVDVPLMTALMDAYGQLRDWRSAFSIWSDIAARHKSERQMYAPDPLPPHIVTLYRPAVSVVLDICGYADNLPRARKVWDWAETRGMVRANYGNFKSWMECLCRSGNTLEAYEVARGPFMERCFSDRASAAAISPVRGQKNDETELIVLEMLVRFSWQSDSVWEHLRERLPRDFPTQWEVLKAGDVVRRRQTDFARQQKQRYK